MPISGHLFSIDFYCSTCLRDDRLSMEHIHGIGSWHTRMHLIKSVFRYFIQGVPVVLFSLYPSFLLGGLKVASHKSLYFVSLWYIIIHRLAYRIHSWCIYINVVMLSLSLQYTTTQRIQIYISYSSFCLYLCRSVYVSHCFWFSFPSQVTTCTLYGWSTSTLVIFKVLANFHVKLLQCVSVWLCWFSSAIFLWPLISH